MRPRILLLLSVMVGFAAASLTVAPATVFAQDEFDEFDDDFADPADDASDDGGSDDAGDAGGGDAEGGDEFDDLEDDAFEDDLEDDDESDAFDDDGLEDGDLEDDGLGVDDDDDDDGATPDEQAEREARRERRMHMHNTWGGTVGGIHVADAGSGADATFRAQLGLDFFFAGDWLTLPGVMPENTEHSHIGGSLSLSWTPFEFLEIYASLASWANSNDFEDPNLFQVLGDTTFGVKAFYNFEDMRWLTLGGDIHVAFLNTVGDIGLVGDSTGFGIRGNATVDLRELPDRIPFIARLNLGYIFDNSEALVSAVERARYNALPDGLPCPEDGSVPCQEDRHLITRVERYSLQIDRVDRFRIGLGLEAPLVAMENVGDAGADFVISPIVEWVLDIPVNRQGYSCLFIPSMPGSDEPVPGEDGCLERQGAGAFEQRLTLGVRVLPPLQGLNIYVGVDIGLTGVNTFVRELSGQEPYNVRLGFGYAFDTVPRIEEVEREVVREVVRETPPPVRGRIVGTVVEQGEAGTPVAGAVITFPGRELTSQSANEGGAFTTYEMDPGDVEMAISHPEYHDGTCSGTIPEEGGDVEVRCELEALPRVGNIRATVVGDTGTPVGGATVNLSGPSNRSLTTGPDGTFSVNDLAPGTYTAQVTAEAFLIKQQAIEVVARETAEPTITLISRPQRPAVRLRARQIVIRRQVNFATDSSEILPDSTELLSEIADVILRHPELTQIEIQGHTDNRGGRQHNQDLSQRRAEAVRDWLVRAGVDAGRLEARGYGQDDPLVPNITASNRARNRRVQFMIRERAETGEE